MTNVYTEYMVELIEDETHNVFSSIISTTPQLRISPHESHIIIVMNMYRWGFNVEKVSKKMK